MGKEILTLQFGSEANFVGSHFWNIQEEAYGLEQWREPSSSGHLDVDHSVLHRLTESNGYERCTPRVVIVDASGSLGGNASLSFEGRSKAPQDVHTWAGAVSIVQSPAVPTTDFIDTLRESEEDEAKAQAQGQQNVQSPHQVHDALERLSNAARQLQEPGAVGFWTDYLTARLHPSSIWQLPGIVQGVTDFQGYGLGRVHLGGGQVQEEVAERVRLFAEECDSLQGFQLLVDDLAGFGGISAQTVLQLQEDFPKSKILAFPIRTTSSQQGKDRRMQLLSEALSMAELSSTVNLYSPFTTPEALPRASWPQDSLWHSSAHCAALLDSATLPMRLPSSHPGSCDMHALNSLLGYSGNFLCCAASMPCPQTVDEERAVTAQIPFTQRECYSCTPGLPYSDWRSGVEAECLVLRGPHRNSLPLPVDAATAALNAALIKEDQRAARHCCVDSSRMPIPLPFPQLFAPRNPGSASGLSSSLTSDTVSLPALIRLARSSAANALIEQSTAAFQRIAATAAGRSLLGTWGYEQAEIQDTLQEMHHLLQDSDAASDFSNE